MQPRSLAVRAIMSTYAKQVVRPLAITAAILAVLLFTIICYVAASVSWWWLVLLLPLLVVVSLVTIFLAIAFLIIRTVAPAMNRQQKQAAKAYVAKLIDITGTVQTGRFMIAYKILKDVYRRKWHDGFVQQTATKTTSLKPDFEALVRSFER